MNGSRDDLDSQLSEVGSTREGAQMGILIFKVEFLFINGCHWL